MDALSSEPVRPSPFGSPLLRPSALAALALLFLNDHLLKGGGVLPGWLTGKLSDAAGLYLFPIVLFVSVDAAVRAARLRCSRRTLAFAAAALTAAVFTLAKAVPAVNRLMTSAWWGPMVLDRTDLLMLPFAGLGTRAMLAPASFLFPRLLRLGALASALVVCAATQPPPPRCYPMWSVVEPAAVKLGCSWVEAWISKSGKTGMGLSVGFHPVDPQSSCHAVLQAATFRANGLSIPALHLPAAIELEGTSDHQIYVPFAFDNQALWNRSLNDAELRRGVVSLEIALGDQAVERIDVPLSQEWQPASRYGCGAPRRDGEGPATP
jgi:hypothetical protein